MDRAGAQPITHAAPLVAVHPSDVKRNIVGLLAGQTVGVPPAFVLQSQCAHEGPRFYEGSRRAVPVKPACAQPITPAAPFGAIHSLGVGWNIVRLFAAATVGGPRITVLQFQCAHERPRFNEGSVRAVPRSDRAGAQPITPAAPLSAVHRSGGGRNIVRLLAGPTVGAPLVCALQFKRMRERPRLSEWAKPAFATHVMTIARRVVEAVVTSSQNH